jgi:sugar/nucleoside kinase (ribokinase family)
MSADRSSAALVLVVGDANPDLILTGDVVPRFGQVEQLLDGAQLEIGGSAAITAHALARLGRPVWLAAAVGADRFGEQLCADLAAAGVGIDRLTRRPDAPTGLTVVLSQPDDRAILTLPGAIPTLRADEVRAAVTAARAGGLRHLHVSSLFLQPDLARDLPDLLAEVRASGVTTSLDTNDDPAGRWEGVDALLGQLDLLLPNRAEVCALGRDADPQRAAAALAAHGPLVVVKDGSRGAFAVSPSGELIDTIAHPTFSVDTTGAGDTFDAAFLDSWLSGLSLPASLRRAVRAGALAVGALGGTAGQPTRADLSDPTDLSVTPAELTKQGSDQR